MKIKKTVGETLKMCFVLISCFSYIILAEFGRQVHNIPMAAGLCVAYSLILLSAFVGVWAYLCEIGLIQLLRKHNEAFEFPACIMMFICAITLVGHYAAYQATLPIDVKYAQGSHYPTEEHYRFLGTDIYRQYGGFRI